jgi:hypothetical protein
MSPISMLALLIWVAMFTRAAWLLAHPHRQSVTS